MTKREIAIATAFVLTMVVIGCSGHVMVGSGDNPQDIIKAVRENPGRNFRSDRISVEILDALNRIEVQLKRIADKP